MAPATPSRRAAVRTLPAQYAKFLTACIGQLVAYLQLYGTTWHLVPAVTMAGVALAVLGVPNAPKPPQPAPATITRGGYSAGGTTVADLPPPPPSVTT